MNRLWLALVAAGLVACAPVTVQPPPTSAPVTTTVEPVPSTTTVEPSPTSSPAPVTTTTETPAPGPAIVQVPVTFYAAADNDPAGSTAIDDPVIHKTAGGTGTFADPLTFASPLRPDNTGAYARGEKIYAPTVQKYFIREDSCAVSWTATNGCGVLEHVDLYVGNPSKSKSVIKCEESLTSPDNADDAKTNLGTIYRNPPPNLSVDPTPIWSDTTGQCMKAH